MTRARDTALCARDRRVVPFETGTCDLRDDCRDTAGWLITAANLRGCTTHTAEFLRRNT